MLPNLTLVIQGLAFFAVAWVVMKFGWPHIMAAIEERQQKIAEGLAAADRRQKALADAEIAAAANRAREDLRRQVSTLAVAGAEKLLRREIDPNAHKALLDELASELA